jgi:peptidoglycan DL-endopeptidase LytE
MKKNLQSIFFVKILLGTLLFSLAVPLLASAQTTTDSSSSGGSGGITLALGNRSVAAAVLQDLLMKNGYLVLAAPTGYFGTETQVALEAFQAANGLPQTGTLTIPSDQLSAFFASVGSSATAMSLGATGTHVQSLQQFLINGGYLHLSAPTQYFGSLTFAAVQAFQKAHGLPQTGVVDAVTFAAMNGK